MARRGATPPSPFRFPGKLTSRQFPGNLKIFNLLTSLVVDSIPYPEQQDLCTIQKVTTLKRPALSRACPGFYLISFEVFYEKVADNDRELNGTDGFAHILKRAQINDLNELLHAPLGG